MMLHETGRHNGRPYSQDERPLLPFDLVDTIWRRKWCAIGFVAVSMGLGAVYLLLAPRVYPVTARVWVQRQGLTADQGQPSPSPKDDFLGTQAEIIRSPAVIRRAVERLGSPPQDETTPDPVRRIQEALVIKPVLGSSVLTISFTSPDAEKTVPTLQALLDAYRDYMRDSALDSQSETLRLLARNEKELREELESLERQYLELRKESPLMGQGRDFADVQREGLRHIGDRLTDIKNQRIEMENRLRLLSGAATLPVQAGAAGFGGPLVGSTAVAATLKWFPAGETDIQQGVLRARAREQQLSKVFGDKHPELRAAREEAAMWQKALQDSQESGRTTLEQELATLESQEKHLTELYEAEYAKAKATDVFVIKEQQAEAAVQRVRGLYDATLAQLKQWQLIDKSLSAGRSDVAIRVLEMPTVALAAIFPPPALLLALCFVVGTVGGVGWITLADRIAVAPVRFEGEDNGLQPARENAGETPAPQGRDRTGYLGTAPEFPDRRATPAQAISEPSSESLSR